MTISNVGGGLLARLVRTKRTFTAAIGALLFALGLLVAIPAPAGAVTVTPGVNLRPCVNLAAAVCAPVGTTSSTSVTTMRCWRDASWATGAARSNRWFLVYLTDGREGYVHSSYVQGQVATPNCGTLAYVRAADKALSYYGQRFAPSDITAKYAASDWAPGPVGEWSGDCAKLTSSSYRYGAGVSYSSGNAIGQYWTYKNAGVIYGGLPRYGAPVFYNIAAPYGHTAIYIGGRTIISTQGMDGANLPVARHDINYYGNYLGWAKIS